MQFPFFNPRLSEKCGIVLNLHSNAFNDPRFTGSFNHFLLGIWDLYIEKPVVKWRIRPVLFTERKHGPLSSTVTCNT